MHEQQTITYVSQNLLAVTKVKP